MLRPLFTASALVLLLGACAKAPSAGTDDERLIADAGSDAPPDAAPKRACAIPTTPLRAMAANLTSGTKQSWDLGHGARILKGLHPDVVLLQEFNVGDNGLAAQKEFVASLDPDYVFARGSGEIPNGVLSRFPIRESGEWADPLVANRTFSWARIDLPGERDLWAVSVHLLTYDAQNTTEHTTEVNALLDELKQAAPPTDYLLVGGDFNTKTRDDPGIVAFSTAFVTEGPYPEGPTLVGTDPSATSTSRSRPLDWVLASGALDVFEVPVVIGANKFPNGLVFDSRAYKPLEDVAPVELGDSQAEGMQHMGVVRDFAICPSP